MPRLTKSTLKQFVTDFVECALMCALCRAMLRTVQVRAAYIHSERLGCVSSMGDTGAFATSEIYVPWRQLKHTRRNGTQMRQKFLPQGRALPRFFVAWSYFLCCRMIMWLEREQTKNQSLAH